MRGPIVWLIVVAAATAIGGGTSVAAPSTAPGPVAGERITPLVPAIVFGQRAGSFLAARLEDLQIVQPEVGGRLARPVLRARFTVTNDAKDWTARRVSGRVEFLDAAGHPIPLPSGRQAPWFPVGTDAGERLGPGQSVSRLLTVPCPPAVLQKGVLEDPYRTDRIDLPVSIAG
jgi:hypothetical protein